MMFSLFFAFISSTLFVHAQVTVHRANINRLPLGTGPLGYAVVFTEPNSTNVGYAGIVNGLQPNLKATTCNATNGCGVHIHSGNSCRSFTTQGGHFYVNTSVVTSDPWVHARYSSDSSGKANFQGVLDIGTNAVDSKVFIGKKIGFCLSSVIVEATLHQLTLELFSPDENSPCGKWYPNWLRCDSKASFQWQQQKKASNHRHHKSHE